MTYKQDKEDNEINLIESLIYLKYLGKVRLIDIKKEIQNVKTNMRQNNKTLIDDVKKIFLKNKEILDE